MKKLTILKEFHDAYNFSKVYTEGMVGEFDVERADRLIRLGLATHFEEEEHREAETTESTETEDVDTEVNDGQQEIVLEAESPEESPRRGRRSKK